MKTITTEEQAVQAGTGTAQEPKATTKAKVAPRKPHVAPSKAKSGNKATPPKKSAKAAKGAKSAKKSSGARQGTKTEKVLDLLKGAGGAGDTGDYAFYQLLNEVTQAQLECQRTKKALQVHRDGCTVRQQPDPLA